MKKIVCFVAALALVGIAHASKLSDMLEKVIGEKTKILKEIPLKEDPNLKFVVLQTSSGEKAVIMANKAESVIYVVPAPQAFITANEQDSAALIDEVRMIQQYNENFKTHKAVKDVIAKIPQDYIISLKGKNPKKTYYIVSDPLCPHCQNELQNIEKRLQNGNVKMIVVGMMGEQSSKKAAEIYREAKKSKSDSDKIALLKKVYNPNYKSSGGDEKIVQDVTKALIGKDKVNGTPYIIEEDS